MIRVARSLTARWFGRRVGPAAPAGTTAVTPSETQDDDGGAFVPPAVRAVLEWVAVVGIALLVAVLVRTFLVEHYRVDGESMYPTLHPGDRVLVNKMSYRLHDPHRGDVVVLHELDGSQGRDLIKRVIALPGETIEIGGCDVYIDGFRLDEPYLGPATLSSSTWCEFGPVTVEPDHVFVMGDNRESSKDSRVLGAISADEVVGRAFVVLWPKSDWQWL